MAARIEGHDVMSRGEMADLEVPDFSGHRPSWNEYEKRTGSCFKVVKPDTVTRREMTAFDLGLCPGRRRSSHASDNEQCREKNPAIHSHFLSFRFECLASSEYTDSDAAFVLEGAERTDEAAEIYEKSLALNPDCQSKPREEATKPPRSPRRNRWRRPTSCC